MNERDRIATQHLDPAYIAMLNRADAILAPQGIAFCIVDPYRSGTQQDADFAHGRNAQGMIVNKRLVITNDRAGQSPHQYGEAADIVPYLVGDSGALDWNPESPRYVKFVAGMKAAGLAWGGDWIHFKDEDHFQSPNIPVNPNAAMQADFHAGLSLPAIWAKVASGVYGR